MKGAVLLFLMLWAFWILLNGAALEEIAVGGIVAALISAGFGYLFLRKAGRGYVRGFFTFLAYIPYYAWQEIKCVSDVTWRILTGKINPAIVEVPHTHESVWGITMLSNSITMTPGTLTLEAEHGRLYVHWLTMGRDKKQIAAVFDKFLNKIWG
jgi:multicomponent Na+:H+ antiporter subunit E